MISEQTFILIAIILILIDIFIPTDFTTFIAYIIFSFLIAFKIDVPILYQIVIGIISWWLMVVSHYYVFRKYIRVLTNRLISPTKIKSGIEIHFGKTGQIKLIEHRLMVVIEGEVYQFTEQDGKKCNPGDSVTIITFTDDKLKIKLNS